MKLTEIVNAKLPTSISKWFRKHARVMRLREWNDGSRPLLTGNEIAQVLKGTDSHDLPGNTFKLWLEFDNHKYEPTELKPEEWNKAFGRVIMHVVYSHAHFDNSNALFVPEKVSTVYLSNCEINSLKFPDDVKCRVLAFEDTKIKCGLLGLLKNEGIEHVEGAYETDRDLEKALSIVDKHLADRNIIECQSDLIDAGFEEWAKL